MNTEEDWKRERAETALCPACKGLGYLPANYSRGAVPCGCDEPQDDETVSPGTEPKAECTQ